MSDSIAPALSVVIVVYKMREQARRTLQSLCTDYQRDVNLGLVEFIVVENRSNELLGEEAALSVNSNIRYFLRDETLPSPVPALNFGWQHAKASHVALMIDGARMLTPGVLGLCLKAIAANDAVAITVPGYHLGEKLQQEAAAEGYDASTEQQLLNTIEWPVDGYRLFDIACLSGSCRSGYLLPMSESNFFVLHRDLLAELEGFDTAFDTHGGGYANLDLYKRACAALNGELCVLFGEGTFHQFHGGATTGGSGKQERDNIMLELREQYEQLRGEKFSPPKVNATYFGRLHPPALAFLQHSLACAKQSL